MKTPKTLIREYERTHQPTDPSLRLYTYVRPRADGEATIEVWGARSHTRRKGNSRGYKCFFKLKTDEGYFRTKDTLQYHSWSPLAHDCVKYHFPEAGGTDYRTHLRDMVGVWVWRDLTRTRDAHLPAYATMLNGFEGTRFKYCGYDAMCGLPVTSFLKLWEKYPKAEIVSKTKMFQLLNERFLARFETDKAFAQYVYANRATISLHHMETPAIETAFKRKKTCAQYLEPKLRKAEIARQRMEEEERKRREAELASMAKWDKKMTALYERIKGICGTYGCFEVEVPKTSKDMYAESDAMHNCVGKCYTSNHAMGHDIIIFLRKDGKPCVDMRIDPEKMEIVECRYVCNKDAMHNEEVMTEARKVLTNFTRVWRKAA